MDNSVNTTPKLGIRIPEWDIPTVTDMGNLFLSPKYNIHIPKWDIPPVTDFSNLFTPPGTTKEEEDKATRTPTEG